MLHKISRKTAGYLVKKEVVSLEEKEIYEYGLELIFSSIFIVTTILLIAIWMNELQMGAIYLATYIPLKMTCGGYHASTYGRCYIISVISYVVIYLTTKWVFIFHLPAYIWIMILIGSILYLYKNSPVKNKNHPVSETILQKNKKIATMLLSVECILLTISYLHVKESILLNFIVITIMSVAIFILPTKRKENELC